MDIEKLIDEIEPDDLPKPYKRYAQSIGVRNLYMLSQLAGGRTIYIPKPDALFKEVVKKKIICEYESGNTSTRRLAEKYQLSRTTVMAYLKGY